MTDNNPTPTSDDANNQPHLGERVGAYQSIDTNTIMWIGYGTLTEYAVPPGTQDGGPVGGFADTARTRNVNIPKITLDDGTTVWGCECNWAPEEQMKEMVQVYLDQGRYLVQVDVAAERKRKLATLSEALSKSHFVAFLGVAMEMDGVSLPLEMQTFPIYAEDDVDTFINEVSKQNKAAKRSLAQAAEQVKKWVRFYRQQSG